jgi:hypothetical protein
MFISSVEYRDVFLSFIFFLLMILKGYEKKNILRHLIQGGFIAEDIEIELLS